MAQSTILAAGTAAATSSDVVLAAGESCVVGLFSDTANAQVSQQVRVMMDTPGADNVVALLSTSQLQVQLAGPGTFRVVREEAPAGGASFGVFKEA